MKKIDLHIHTVAAEGKDAAFTFDISKFEEYTKKLSIDAVAITNHNLFDKIQFMTIQKALKGVVVFPGIEIDFEGGHLLMIAEADKADDFANQCNHVAKEVKKSGSVTVDRLKAIFTDLDEYLLIPHYDKSPKIKQTAIDQLRAHISAGEVSSPKKFNRILKEDNQLTPVLFSDSRIDAGMDPNDYQGRHTFIQVNAIKSLNNIKAAFKDKNKVFLSNTGKRGFFQIFNNGQELSNGLNVIFGERSSGKTFLLDQLSKGFNTEERSIKYIRQFDLVREDEDKFNKLVEREKSFIREKYLGEFKKVVEDVTGIERRTTDHKLSKYIETLLEFAFSEKLHDEFSNATLFTETPFRMRNDSDLETLIKATNVLLENRSYKQTIDKYIPEENVRNLLNDLAIQYKANTKERLKKAWTNGIVKAISQKLKYKTASPNIENNDIDFYAIKIERKSVIKFNAIAQAVKKRKIIDENPSFGKFNIQAISDSYAGAMELHNECGRQISFGVAFKKYNSPIQFLEELKNIAGLNRAELYKYFCKVTYQVLNKYGKRVSGGERAEFNLLKALQDARQYEMLLVDEPESSFDNLFLKDNVNKEIKELSNELPVVVVTHNNTVGMLMYPDYILYTRRQIVGDKDEYKVFSGSPGDKEFKTTDSEAINSYDVLMNTLEAGETAYDARKGMYKGFKK